ncbi:M10 family metallopeptidase C-terminal domain-containing protein [Tropicimonas marinistellae]|uniref:M10 family metallopeptidase C-terminal domain-containing protein n=1 Tax=Tropicimonas marinistellae TaxID=1739787 RepID=UPI00083307B6|nr:calcium-binding protein [Tropicimonas marinistellae]
MTYLNIDNIDVSLGDSMDANPFVNVTTAQSLINIIDAASPETTETHTQASHVWINSQPLELEFDFGLEYNLTDLHFWNYHTETYDVDRIQFTFRDADRKVVGRLDFTPDLGTGVVQTAQDYPLDFPSRIQYVTAILSGTNGEVDFNNLGFTGERFCEDEVIGTKKDDLFESCEEPVFYDGRGHRETGDTVSYWTSPKKVTVNLAKGEGQFGDAKGDTYRNIENIVGSRKAGDRLIGNGADNILMGGAGGDWLDGRGGDDAADYSLSRAGVKIDLSTGLNKGGHAEGDTLNAIENIIGSDHADTLVGDGADNVLQGGKGSDLLEGRSGADRLIGGNGKDEATYRGSFKGVQVNLETGAASRGHAEGDRLKSIENLSGSTHNDLLVGDEKVNLLRGLGGNDTLRGSAGKDTLIGGGGYDTASYKGSEASVEIHLGKERTVGGHAQGDLLIGIEAIEGSRHQDRLIGDSGSNRLDGGGGRDTLRGGLGDDILIGGGGGDKFVFIRQDFSRGRWEDTISDFQSGLDLIDLRSFGYDGLGDLKIRDLPGSVLVITSKTDEDDLRIRVDLGSDGSDVLKASDFLF